LETVGTAHTAHRAFKLSEVRDGITAFFKDPAREEAWDVVMGLVVLGYLALLMYDSSPSLPLQMTFSIIFLAEFSVRCWAADSRRQYLLAHWIDLIACVPYVGAFRVLRLVKVGVLALKLYRYLCRRWPALRKPSLVLEVLFIAVWVGSAYGMWLLEHDVNPHFHSFQQALCWSFITVTTLGWGVGNMTPITTQGNILSGLLVFVGVGLVSAASGKITACLLQQKEPEVDLKAAAAELRTALQEVQDLAQALRLRADVEGRTVDQGVQIETSDNWSSGMLEIEIDRCGLAFISPGVGGDIA